MLDNPLYNPGGYFTNIKGYEAIQNNWLAIGEIVNLSGDGEYQSGLIQRYDVKVYNLNGLIVNGCIPITSNFSGNGVGEYATYKVGDAVIFGCLYNSYDNGIIFGSVSLPGDMDVFMGKDTERTKLRQLQGDNSYAPQPLVSPDRVQNPSANKVVITSTQMDKDSYKNPDLIASSSDRTALVREQALPTGIEIDSGLGDKGTYFRGLEYKYINGSYYHIVVADKEDECAKASKVAKVALDTVNKLKKLNPNPRNSNSLITSKYRAEQHQKIYEIALEAAKNCNTKSLVTKQATDTILKENTTESGNKTTADYKPNETKLETPTSKSRLTLTDKDILDFISYTEWQSKPLSQPIIEGAINRFYDRYSIPNTNKKVTQPLIDKILADPKYLEYKKGKDKLNKTLSDIFLGT